MSDSHLQHTIGMVKSEVGRRRAEIARLEGECAQLEQTLDGLTLLTDVDRNGVNGNGGDGYGEAMYSKMDDIDKGQLRMCRNLQGRLILIAEATGGVVDTDEATTVLWNAGTSRGKQSSLKRGVQRELSEHPDYWEHTGDVGRYRYLHPDSDGLNGTES